MARRFRLDESIRAERFTWEMIPHFLRARGFHDVRDEQIQNGLTIDATSPGGEDLVMRVRLCAAGEGRTRPRTAAARHSISKISRCPRFSRWSRGIPASST